MSSITKSFGKNHTYPELSSLSSEEIKKYKNVVLIIVDGLGSNYLKKQKDSFLLKNLKTNMTSTFLSTTSCANTAFHVGYPAQQHGIHAWDINLKEVGAITAILLFTPMYRGSSLSASNFKMKDIMGIEPLHKGFQGKCFTLINEKISNSAFTNYVASNTEIIPTKNYKDTFSKLTRLIKKKSAERRFIHIYLYELDHFIHTGGIDSKNAKEFFKEINQKIKILSKTIKDTLIIVTADHGLIDIPKGRTIWIENIKGLKECMTIPLSGEPRVRDCFVRPNKVQEFENIVKTKMSNYCWCFKGEQLIKDHLYGLGKPNKRLSDRIGDYVLIMKENYVLRDKLANYKKEKKKNNLFQGAHGGISEDEMLVPLILINTTKPL